MTRPRFYRHPLPGYEERTEDLPGRLIVLEGTDGVGRSTQISLLREWLEANGYAVATTGMKRSLLAGKGIQAAMATNYIDKTTLFLFYVTDFADRLARDILPALRAGFVVITDRYIYSLIARAQARDVDPEWIRNLVGFAVVPDLILYLKADLAHLLPRILTTRGFDYWESGMDHLKGVDYYDAYTDYQGKVIDEFDRITDEFDMQSIDANRGVNEVFGDLRARILDALAGMKPMANPILAEGEGD